MEKANRKCASIKKSFVTAVSVTLLLVFLFSAATLYGCRLIQKRLLPDFNEVWLQTRTTYADGTVTEGSQRFQLDVPAQLGALVSDGDMYAEEEQVEYTIEMIESSFSMLSPSRKLLYRGTQTAMAVLPLFYAAAGIALCAWWFYRKKIAPPVRILTDAIGHIQESNLDFEIKCPGEDELGQLCIMFERMRQVLYENNRQLWRTIEDQRLLQASVAHDLRNPITILEGYIESLQNKLSLERLTPQKLEHTLENMSITAKRLERYTDCMRDLHALQKTAACPSRLAYPDGLNQLTESISMMLRQKNMEVDVVCRGAPREIFIDQALLARILENIFSNASRYAKTSVHISFLLEENVLSIEVVDDGPGFSAGVLEKRAITFYSEDAGEKHLGLGLATARILCQKQKGQIFLSNSPSGGACVRIRIPLPPEN